MKTITAPLVLAIASLVGCSQGTASRPVLGQSETLPAIDRSPRGLTPASGPNVTSANRSHWETITVSVGPDGSRGWFWPVPLEQRHDGAHPTALSALDAEADDSIFDLFGTHLRAAGGAIVAPIRLFHHAHDRHPHEHASGYERASVGAWRDGESQ